MKQFILAALLLAGTAFAQEDQLIRVLTSAAPLQEKSDACRELARVGTGQAVPALAPLLADEKLSHMARYALETIADPAGAAALRRALDELQGPLLVGVMDSLGVRRDTAAVEALTRFLNGADPMAAQAAARALGNIGGPAVPDLKNALTHGSPVHRVAVCEGLFRCAEALPGAEATAIYDAVRALSDLPYPVEVAAWRGAVLSRGAQGVPLWVETIRAESSLAPADVMRIAMDMPGTDMTTAMARELSQVNQEKQLLLVQALGCRGDATVAPALVPLAERGPVARRVAAIRSLVQLGNPSSLPALVALAQDSEPTVSNAAQSGLVGFPGHAADAAVVALMDDPDTGNRVMAIGMAEQRRIAAAVPPLLQATDDADSAVVNAGFKALGELAGTAHIPGVVDALLKVAAVDAAETALTAMCARQPDKAACTDMLLPGLARAQGESKLALLRVLRTLGDAQALAAVRAATQDPDAAVRETALRALCDWPTVAALPDLEPIARTTTDSKLRILALRGQLRLIPMQTRPDAQKLSQVKAMLPLIERTEEQRLTLATLSGLPCAESLALVMTYLPRDGLQEEASVAAVGIAEKIVAADPAAVGEALPQIQTSNRQLAERIRKVLAQVPADMIAGGFTPIFNGRDLTGWEGMPGWWTVEDGALTSESTPEKPCQRAHYLFWRGGRPADFELLADFRLTGSGNSGIQIRSEERPDWDTFGYQADMTGDGELIGFVYHHQHGLIAGRGEKAFFPAQGEKTVTRIGDPAALLEHFRPGEWNTYRVVCRGSDITLHVNDVLMCQISDHRVSEAARRGIIALQMHPGPPMKVQFKNLRLRQIK